MLLSPVHATSAWGAVTVRDPERALTAIWPEHARLLQDVRFSRRNIFMTCQNYILLLSDTVLGKLLRKCNKLLFTFYSVKK